MKAIIGGLLIFAFACSLLIGIGLLLAKAVRSVWRRLQARRWRRFQESQYLPPTWEHSTRERDGGPRAA